MINNIATIPRKRASISSRYVLAFRDDDARTALRKLDGCAGPGGEMVHVGLSGLQSVQIFDGESACGTNAVLLQLDNRIDRGSMKSVPLA
jgi:hypothetical protein